MKKLYWLLATLVVLSLVLTACGGAEAPAAEEPMAEEPAEAPAEEPAEPEPTAEPVEPVEPIKIGASMPLTGGFAIPGQKHTDGYQLCVDLINERGGLLGRPVELIVSDNQSDVDTILA